MITYCEDCDNVTEATRDGAPWQWSCIKFPYPDAWGYVTRTKGIGSPYKRCKDINTGLCPLFTPRGQ